MSKLCSIRSVSVLTWLGLLVCSASIVTPARAATTVDLSLRVSDSNGDTVFSDATQLAQGENESGQVAFDTGVLTMAVTGTFNLTTINQYATQVTKRFPPLDSVNWVTKLGVDDLTVGWIYETTAAAAAEAGPKAVTMQRGAERYAAFAIAPNSASIAGSAGAVANADLDFSAQFFGGSVPLDFENNVVPPFGNGPLIHVVGDLLPAVQQINSGAFLLVDLDQFGVAVGSEYGFLETYILFDHGAPFGETASFSLDPVVGTAVPEPASGAAMLALGAGALLLRPARRNRRRQQNRQ